MVEWKKLGEVCNLVRGKVISKDYLRDNEGKYPVYSSQTANNGIFGCINSYMFDGDYLTWTTDGAYAGTIFRRKGKFNITNVCGLIDIKDNNLNQDFLYYWLSLTAKDYVNEGMGNPKLMSNVAATIIIPLPSLSEQERIVGMLDTFTSSIENLKSQISLRRKQYEHYRDKLLDLEGKPEKDIHSWGEFCEMIKGNGVQKADFEEEGYGCVHYGQIYTHYGSFTYEVNKFVSKEVFDKAKKASKGDIIMTDTSENVEDICKSVAYLGEEDIAVSNHALIIKHKQNAKFLSFSTLTNSFFVQKKKVVFGVKVSGINPKHLAQIKIYLPSLEEQSRIVSILDEFEASIKNLEAQLEARGKQYEYYRNKLLTFE
jgi:type I restriction enzyme S subunit